MKIKAREIGLAIIIIGLILGMLFYFSSHLREEEITPEVLISNVKSRFELKSMAFENEGIIPRKYTCDGDNLSPPLKWRGHPPQTVSFVLIVYDIDAPKGVFYHWLLYSIPVGVNELPEGIERREVTQYGLQGRNDFNRIGYDGPCPPSGKPHRYIFLLLALDCKLNIKPGAGYSEILTACKGHILAYAKLMGRYSR